MPEEARMPQPVDKRVCRKSQGVAEPGNTCLQTPGTCESCPDWVKGERRIITSKRDHHYCSSCGKNTAKRKGKSPAPIALSVGSIYMALCMTCAKQISNRLDVIIAAIEECYGKI